MDLIDTSRRRPPIAALTEAGNQVLRRGIEGKFSSATEMARELDRCVKEMGVALRPEPGPPPPPEPVPPPPAHPVKPPRLRARWIMGALLLLLVVGAAIYIFQRPEPRKWVVEAKSYIDRKDFPKALPLLEKAADGGDTTAMNLLGALYWNGDGVPQSYGKAREWYQKAADAGNRVAKEALTHFPLLVPDIYKSIQAAIDAAGPGGTVRVKAGRYNEALQFKDGITLEGEDRVKTVVHFASPATAVSGQSHYQAPLEVRDCRSGAVRKLTFLQEQSDTRANGANAFKVDAVVIFDSSVTIEECQATSSASNGIGVYGSRSAPQILRNQCMSSARDGIYFGDGAQGTAQGDVCDKNSEDGIEVSGNGTSPVLKDNTCSSNKLSGIRLRSGSKAAVQGNKCEGNQKSGIIVSDKGTSPELTNNQCNSNTIDGIYFGDSAQGTAQGNLCEKNSEDGIEVYGNSTDPVLKDNTCSGNTFRGIILRKGCKGTVQGNVCEKNLEDGIRISDEGTDPIVEKNNKCSGNKLNGIMLWSGSKGTVRGNVCEGNQQSGIALFNKGTSPELTNNQCSSNAIDGIYFGDGAQGTAQGNVCAQNEDSGIAINAASPVLYRNTLKFNKSYGLAYNESAKPDLREPQTYEGNERGEVNAHIQYVSSSTPTPTPSPTRRLTLIPKLNPIPTPSPTATARPASSSPPPFPFPSDDIETSTVDITNVVTTKTLGGVSFSISFSVKSGLFSLPVGSFKMTLYLDSGLSLTYQEIISKGKAVASTTAEQKLDGSGNAYLFVPKPDIPGLFCAYAIRCSESAQILSTTGKNSGFISP